MGSVMMKSRRSDPADCRCRSLVAVPLSEDLLLCAKHLRVEANRRPSLDPVMGRCADCVAGTSGNLRPPPPPTDIGRGYGESIQRYRGCERVGWPSHWDVGQPLNRQHDKGGNQSTPAVKPGGSGDLLPPSPPAEKATARQDQGPEVVVRNVRASSIRAIAIITNAVGTNRILGSPPS
jgi:hypothetical protein